jgi:hypothetical protein
MPALRYVQPNNRATGRVAFLPMNSQAMACFSNQFAFISSAAAWSRSVRALKFCALCFQIYFAQRAAVMRTECSIFALFNAV